MLVNGFANPIIVSNVLTKLRDPNVYDGAGWQKQSWTSSIIIKANNNIGYWSPDDNKTYYTTSRMLGRVMGQETEGGKTFYKILVSDGASEINGTHLHVAHTDILVDPGPMFSNSVAGVLGMVAGLDFAGVADLLMNPVLSKVPSAGRGAANAGYNILRALIANPESHFMDPANNPFTRAFDETMGRGLAGVLGGVTLDWLSDFPWETDYNARAPIGVNISFQFDVIHDIPPGLDHSGYNRAPLYNVGEIMRNVAGDPHGDDGSVAKSNFTQGSTVRILGNKKGKK